MTRRIAIFAPSGVGKSTLIKIALKQGIKAYDFEDFSSQERIKKAQEILKKDFNDIVLFNAGDLQTKDFPFDVELVLLLPPKDIYLKRLKKRDKLNPEKKGQQGNMKYEIFF
ncbi:MAG: hypothetical protein ACKKMR_00690 [Candidatus Nealsonbacteria bacterium]